MAHIRGVEVGKILLTPGDVMEHCYPEMDKRWKAGIGPKAAAPASPVARPEIVPPPPPATPAATPKSKAKKAKASEQPKAEAEEMSERITEPGPESEQGSGYDPFKE